MDSEDFEYYLKKTGINLNELRKERLKAEKAEQQRQAEARAEAQRAADALHYKKLDDYVMSHRDSFNIVVDGKRVRKWSKYTEIRHHCGAAVSTAPSTLQTLAGYLMAGIGDLGRGILYRKMTNKCDQCHETEVLVVQILVGE